MVFGYERKGFIRLQECFRVSKIEDHYHSLTLDVIHILFCRSSLICRFFFFIALLWHTHFILDVTFSSDLGMPPNI
jgi:hypothetical protein